MAQSLLCSQVVNTENQGVFCFFTEHGPTDIESLSKLVEGLLMILSVAVMSQLPDYVTKDSRFTTQ